MCVRVYVCVCVCEGCMCVCGCVCVGGLSEGVNVYVRGFIIGSGG